MTNDSLLAVLFFVLPLWLILFVFGLALRPMVKTRWLLVFWLGWGVGFFGLVQYCWRAL